jgi:hypothetical protein
MFQTSCRILSTTQFNYLYIAFIFCNSFVWSAWGTYFGESLHEVWSDESGMNPFCSSAHVFRNQSVWTVCLIFCSQSVWRAYLICFMTASLRILNDVFWYQAFRSGWHFFLSPCLKKFYVICYISNSLPFTIFVASVRLNANKFVGMTLIFGHFWYTNKIDVFNGAVLCKTVQGVSLDFGVGKF